ncbi:MAG TPA: HAMP domain-containing sensor histidine kinase [Nitrospirota bacterium]|nr:HAMP domain-containing sensor histidine kinase [Nitrospirota bacterium]
MIHVLPSRLSDERFTERFVTLVREELDRTQQLIDNLLAYGKNIELRNEEWTAVTALMLPAANRYHLTVIPDPSVNGEILGDQFYLDLFFQNVFRNSREAGADEVRVAFRVDQLAPETAADFTCEDNGVGYPETADLDELMSPFVTSRSRGSGLGLYLAKKIITAHDGTLSLYRKEKGAGVKVTLPGKRVSTRE